MRTVLIAVLFATLGFYSAAEAAASTPPPVGRFAISGVKVDATAASPREARDLAMAQGRALAWSKLFRSFTERGVLGTEPRLVDNELLGLILRTDANNERRNTTRYVADVTFHFNPVAVEKLLRKYNALSTETVLDAEWDSPADPQETTHLAVNARFDSEREWTILRTRLSAAREVTGVEIVGRSEREAQLFLSYAGDAERLQAALARHSLELTSREGQLELQLGAISATTASFAMSGATASTR